MARWKSKYRWIVTVCAACSLLLLIANAAFAVPQEPGLDEPSTDYDKIVFDVRPVPGTTVHPGTYLLLFGKGNQATFYHTTDGSTPTRSSPSGAKVDLPNTPNTQVTVKVLAVALGKTDETASYTYNVDDQVAPPESSIPADSPLGEYTPIGEETDMTFHSPTTGATVGYFPFNGEGGGLIRQPTVHITGKPGQRFHISVIAEKEGLKSSHANFDYEIRMRSPSAEPGDGAAVLASSMIQLKLYNLTDHTEVHYTTDGSTPTRDSPIGTTVAIPQNAPTGSTLTVKAIALSTDNNYKDSLVATYRYLIGSPMAPPSALPVNGTTLVSGSTVWLSSTTPGATVSYTTDGSEPRAGGPTGNSVTITGKPGDTVTVRAIASKADIFKSAEATFQYKIADPADIVASPSAYPLSGAVVPLNSTIALNSATPGATIYYTTDGSIPTLNRAHGRGVVVHGFTGQTLMIRAIAVVPGKGASAVSTFIYTKGSPTKVPYPTANVATGALVNNNTKITLKCKSPTADIYYTTDGSTPTVKSTKGNTVTITGASGAVITVQAIAVESGIPSPVSGFTYKVRSGVIKK